MHRHLFARIVVILELFVYLVHQCVDARHGLKLDTAEDGAFEGLRECLVDLGALRGLRVSVSAIYDYSEGRHTSLSRASKKVRPEWPVMVQIKRF
mgnify:CR=1 FL=1